MGRKIVSEEAMIGRKIVEENAVRYYLWCPGCYEQAKIDYPNESKYWMNSALHCFSSAVHKFNMDMERPTLSPSLLVTGSKCCHSYVSDGRIRFLGDCNHPLANQEVELLDAPPIPVPEDGD